MSFSLLHHSVEPSLNTNSSISPKQSPQTFQLPSTISTSIPIFPQSTLFHLKIRVSLSIMETRDDAVVEIESLLSSDHLTNGGDHIQEDDDDENSTILYTASFREMEESVVKYQTAQWVLYSLLLIIAWGIGVFMLLYLPVRRFILRKDIRSRKLYVTRNAIVYKVTRPVAFPCFGELKKEKYVLLPSVADIVIEQGYLQSFFGVYSVRIENAGVRRPPSDDVQIQGITNPSAFRKAVLSHLANMRAEAFSRQITATEGAPTLRDDHPQVDGMSSSNSCIYDAIPPGEVGLLQKLEEVGTSIKRVHKLIEEQQSLDSQAQG